MMAYIPSETEKMERKMNPKLLAFDWHAQSEKKSERRFQDSELSASKPVKNTRGKEGVKTTGRNGSGFSTRFLRNEAKVHLRIPYAHSKYAGHLFHILTDSTIQTVCVNIGSRNRCPSDRAFRQRWNGGSVRAWNPKEKTMKKLSMIMVLLVGATALFAQVPGIINYQGRVAVNGTNFNGAGAFKFALVGNTNTLRQATATANLGGSFVTSYTVTDGGAGYSTAPAVTVVGGGGSGATATANVSGGVVTTLTPVNAGSGYTSPPTVTIAAPPSGAVNFTFWSNDGSGAAGSQPATAVSLPVVKGLYSVLLGDASMTNMTAISAAAFSGSDVRLRVWFNDGSGFQQLSPDQRIGAVGYAMNVSGAVGAGLADINTFFMSSTAATGGDGSMGRPWNSLYALTNHTAGFLNGKTVILLAGTYTTSTDIAFTNTYTNLTIKGMDPQNVFIVSTNNSYRIFTCTAGATNIVFDSLTLTSTNSNGDGGAIYLQPGCTAQNCTFRACNAGSSNGGAVYCNYGGTIQNCTFSGNSGWNGGGVCCSSGGMVQNCTFSGNSVPGSSGGGVYCSSGGTVQNCTFSGNSASVGGGVALFYSGCTMQNCTFNGNSGTSGGGVFCNSGGTVQNCSIIRGGGTTNSVFSVGGGIKWMSIWTNQNSAADFVTYSISLNN